MLREADAPGIEPSKKDWSDGAVRSGVVMKDGADNLTLENFAVTEETAKEASGAQGKYIDRDWPTRPPRSRRRR
jgi:hypothetical protein